jgi:hypothetical protein
MREQPDPFDNPFCVASDFVCDPHEAWRLYLARLAPRRDYSPFDKLFDEAPLPPGYRRP